jgi:hypothetical protein
MIVDSLPLTADLGTIPEFLVRRSSAAPMRTTDEHGSETFAGTQNDAEVEDLFENRSRS